MVANPRRTLAQRHAESLSGVQQALEDSRLQRTRALDVGASGAERLVDHRDCVLDECEGTVPGLRYRGKGARLGEDTLNHGLEASLSPPVVIVTPCIVTPFIAPRTSLSALLCVAPNV